MSGASSSNFSETGRRDGLTLIETLIALAIAIVVMALVFTSLRTVGRVMRGQQRRERRAEALAVLQNMSHELSCLCSATISNQPAFKLASQEGTPEDSPVLTYSTVKGGVSGPARSEIVRKQYRLGERERELLCQSRPLRGPGSVETGQVMRVLSGVDHFNVSVFEEGEWQDSWHSEGEMVLPEMVELELACAGEETNSVRILIPGGHSVTSTIERASR